MVAIVPAAHETDVLVAGGGPAGLAAAIAARQKGFRVTLADAAEPPIDKACGEGLMPAGVEALASLGIELEPQQSISFRGICFVGSGVRAEAAFARERGQGVRRTTLHGILARHAAEAGVTLRWGARVEAAAGRPVTLSGERVEYQWLVAADGQNSLLRRWAGLDRGRGRARRFGFRRHFRIAPWSDCVEVYWGVNCQLYVTPVAANEVCVAVLSRDPQLRVDAALDRFPEVRRRLAGAELSSTERGGVCGNRSFRAVASGRVVLIGDASGSVDAITGDGISLAFRQAIALADAMEQGSLASYEEAHRAILSVPTLTARLLLSMDRRAWLRDRVIRRLRNDPRMFQRIFAAHAGDTSPGFGARQIASLGWRVLTP